MAWARSQRMKETADMTLLADLDAVRTKHNVTRLKAARVLLRGAAANARDARKFARLAVINAARALLKGKK